MKLLKVWCLFTVLLPYFLLFSDCFGLFKVVFISFFLLRKVKIERAHEVHSAVQITTLETRTKAVKIPIDQIWK